ncbi:MAG: zinc finger domain-containing protein [Candidatus ainarchaeum sp.]|nr:zinc finger domain-containing protein [Candidatus ainarchaeum sp.]
MEKCSSCNKEVVSNYTTFKCPSCGKTKVIRCERCKTTVKTYRCKECGFIGP